MLKFNQNFSMEDWGEFVAEIVASKFIHLLHCSKYLPNKI